MSMCQHVWKTGLCFGHDLAEGHLLTYGQMFLYIKSLFHLSRFSFISFIWMCVVNFLFVIFLYQITRERWPPSAPEKFVVLHILYFLFLAYSLLTWMNENSFFQTWLLFIFKNKIVKIMGRTIWNYLLFYSQLCLKETCWQFGVRWPQHMHSNIFWSSFDLSWPDFSHQRSKSLLRGAPYA